MDFLLKPVDINELQKVEAKLLQIQAMRKGTDTESYTAVVGHLVHMMHNPGVIKRITLNDGNGYKIVDVTDIIYLEGEDNYTTFFLTNNKKMIVSKTLKEYETLLEELGFFRIHKSNIINLVHLKSIKKGEGMEVVMTDGRPLPVSRRRSTELLEKANQYLH